MTTTLPKELTNADIKEFLETAPLLYAWREFKKPRVNRGSLWIKEIDAYCDVCEQPHRHFKIFDHVVVALAWLSIPLNPEPLTSSFRVFPCRKSHREYLSEQVLDDESIRLQKYGELPGVTLIP